MTASTSRLAYDDIFTLLEQVMDKERGVRITFKKRKTREENIGEAFQFRTRIHTARTIDRVENAGLYEKDHPLFGRSRYDILCASIRYDGEAAYIYLTKRSLDGLEIEDLDEVEEMQEVAE